MEKYYVAGAHFIAKEVKKQFSHADVIDEDALILKDGNGKEITGVDIAKAIRDGWIEKFIPHKLTADNIKSHPFHVTDYGWKEGDIIHKKAKGFNPDAKGVPVSWVQQKGKYVKHMSDMESKTETYLTDAEAKKLADRLAALEEAKKAV